MLSGRDSLSAGNAVPLPSDFVYARGEGEGFTLGGVIVGDVRSRTSSPRERPLTVGWRSNPRLEGGGERVSQRLRANESAKSPAASIQRSSSRSPARVSSASTCSGRNLQLTSVRSTSPSAKFTYRSSAGILTA